MNTFSTNGINAQLKAGLVSSGSLEKAMLLAIDNGVPSIAFMFNPTELTFNAEVQVNEQSGTQDQKEGTKKVSFSQVPPFSVTMSKIIFDTYETGENVVDKYIAHFKAAVKFIGSVKSKFPNLNNSRGNKKEGVTKNKNGTSVEQKSDDSNRPPLYRFVWGDQVYIEKCFVEKLSYKITMFLPNGTPVRAVIDSLTLKDAATLKKNQDSPPPVSDRKKDSLESRMKFKG
jgi:Contractile injection system tube protein